MSMVEGPGSHAPGFEDPSSQSVSVATVAVGSFEVPASHGAVRTSRTEN